MSQLHDLKQENIKFSIILNVFIHQCTFCLTCKIVSIRICYTKRGISRCVLVYKG